VSEDSQHWYLPDGTPFYECKARDGHMRPVTLRDARKVHAVPSVTTVLSVVAKPNLEVWKVQQGILAALTLPRKPSESEADWLQRVRDDAKAQTKAAAEEGSRIHAALEANARGQAYPQRYQPHVQAVRAEIAKLYPAITDWVPETRFAHPDGFGGMCDLHSPSTGVCLDYKGKDGDFSDGKRLAYDQHWQLAGYQRGMELPKATCASVFVSRTHPGKVASHVWSTEDMQQGQRVFDAALALWQAIKNYPAAQSAQMIASSRYGVSTDHPDGNRR